MDIGIYVCSGVKVDGHHDFHSFVFGTRGAGDECEGLRDFGGYGGVCTLHLLSLHPKERAVGC